MTTTVLDPGSPPGLADPPTSGGLFGSDHEPLPSRPGGLGRVTRETRLLVGRSLRTIRHVPERLRDVTIQPVIFTLLFVYVFGSAITVPGVRYQDYLLPGLLGQSLAFGVMGSATATATDFSSGVIDRFRSLPIKPVGVITPRSSARCSNNSWGSRSSSRSASRSGGAPTSVSPGRSRSAA